MWHIFTSIKLTSFIIVYHLKSERVMTPGTLPRSFHPPPTNNPQPQTQQD